MNRFPAFREYCALVMLYFFLHDKARISGTLLQPSNVHSTQSTVITLNTRGIKRSVSNGMPDNFDINVSIDGKHVNKKLRLTGRREEVRLYRPAPDGIQSEDDNTDEYKRDWAVYQGEGEDSAAVLVKRHNDRLVVEGSLSHLNEHYMIQPTNKGDGHVIHRLKKYYKKEPKPMRIKRQSHRLRYKPHKVEVFMIFDHGLYRRLQKFQRFDINRDISMQNLIKEFYGLLINDMDYRYKSFRTQHEKINIHVVMGGVMYFKSAREVPFETNVYPNNWNGIVPSRALLDTSTAYVQKHLPHFDEILIQSGFDFPGGNLGMAWYDGTCRSRRVGVCMNNLDFSIGHISAHELGHNLGIRHDEGGSCVNNHIMHPSRTNQILQSYPLNSWQFSYCSHYQLVTYLNLLDRDDKNCLLTLTAHRAASNRKYVKVESAYGKKMYGLKLTLDQQCQMLHGEGSKHCTSSQQRYSLHRICHAIYCTEPHNQQNCLNRMPYPGTPCGDKKICLNGKCIPDRNSKKVNEKCPFGDRKDGFIGRGRLTCSAALRVSAGYCYTKEYLAGCCDSCEKLKRKGQTSCEYGDRLITRLYLNGRSYSTCDVVKRYNGLCYSLSSKCCKSCPSLRRNNQPSCLYGDKISTRVPMYVDGRTYHQCSRAISSFPGLCYEHHEHCCESCKNIENTFGPNCKYGDHPGKLLHDENSYYTTCDAIRSRNSGLCYKYKSKCCSTCNKLKSDDSNCPYGNKVGNIVWKNGRQLTCEQAITSNDAGLCYNSRTRRDCCQSCKKAYKNIRGCEYGNHKLRYGIKYRTRGRRHYDCDSAYRSLPGICYKHKSQCCKTCAKLPPESQPNCLYGDKPEYWGINYERRNYRTCRDAYSANKDICKQHKSTCCGSCRFHGKPSGGCRDSVTRHRTLKIASQTYTSCSSAIRNHPGICYDNFKDCCASCTQIKTGKACQFGDKLGKRVQVGNVYKTCKEAINQDTKGLCYTYEKTCCQSCSKLKSNTAGCPYGDHHGRVLSMYGNKFECSRLIANVPNLCYEKENWKLCCGSCEKYRTGSGQCMYGDHYLKEGVKYKGTLFFDCKFLIGLNKGMCYEVEDRCCKSCSDVVVKHRGSCRYGDKALKFPIPINGQYIYDCKTAVQISSSICFDYSRQCCDSCQPGLDADCPFGDLFGAIVPEIGSLGYGSCHDVITPKNKGICYNEDERKKCCKTCKKYRNSGAVGCEYGDHTNYGIEINGKIYSCSEAIKDTSTSGYCYQHREKCCETCKRFYTNKEECRYGDKAGKIIRIKYDGKLEYVSCREAVKIKADICNNKDVNDQCCHSCKSTFSIDPKCDDRSPLCAKVIIKGNAHLCDQFGKQDGICCKSCLNMQRAGRWKGKLI